MQKYIYSFINHAFLISSAMFWNFSTVAEAQNLQKQINSQSFNTQQRKEVQKIIGKYIMENPEVIIESIKSMQERGKNQQRKVELQNLLTYKELILNDPTSPVAGKLKGDVSIVEFFDYNCGYCKRAFPTLEKIMEGDKDIRIVFKEFPILSPQSELAARAALATWRQDKQKYIKIHAEFMNLKGPYTESRIFRIAKKFRLDLSQLKKDMHSRSMDETISNNRKLARNLGISGTPGFVIGNKIIRGAIDLATLKGLVSHARTK